MDLARIFSGIKGYEILKWLQLVRKLADEAVLSFWKRGYNFSLVFMHLMTNDIHCGQNWLTAKLSRHIDLHSATSLRTKYLLGMGCRILEISSWDVWYGIKQLRV